MLLSVSVAELGGRGGMGIPRGGVEKTVEMDSVGTVYRPLRVKVGRIGMLLGRVGLEIAADVESVGSVYRSLRAKFGRTGAEVLVLVPPMVFVSEPGSREKMGTPPRGVERTAGAGLVGRVYRSLRVKFGQLGGEALGQSLTVFVSESGG